MVDEEIKQERKIEENNETNQEEKSVKEKKEEEEKVEEEKTVEEKKEGKEEKAEKKPKEILIKRTEAIVNGKSLPISMKHSVALCNFIKGKEIDKARELLEKASQKKIPVPMKGEIPHKKGIMSGRYPINAINHFIKLIKSLRANALINDIEFEKYKIACKANIASRPYKRFGRGRFKRTHVTIKLIPLNKSE
jgi:ribosomal protein L22